MVKVFDWSVQGHDLNEEQKDEDSDVFDEGKSYRSGVKSKAPSHISSKKEKQRKERAAQQELRDAIENNPFHPQYDFVMETFKISKITEIKMFHRIVCEHWGLEQKDF
jgi:hypothetical protein